MGILDRIAGRLDELVSGDADAQPRAPDELAEAWDLVARGDHEAASAAFGRAVDRDAASAEAWWGLGEALARLDRFEPARDALRRALTLSLSPERRPRAQASLGRLYAKAGHFGKAIRELQKAAEALPNDVETHAALGRALIAAGESDGSDWLARAARLPGGTADLLVEAAAAKPDGRAATRLLREAVERAPEDTNVRIALARHLVAQGDLTAALPEAQATTVDRPRDGRTWAVLREVHAATGNYAAAIEAARRETACGAAPAFVVWLRLALGAEDRTAIEEALRSGRPTEAERAETQALLAGVLDQAGIARIAGLAHGPSARRFVIKTLAPSPAPAGNIYALLSWAEQLAARQPTLLPLAVPMARAVEAFDRPLLVAVMGEFNAGKSSFVNALAGAAIAPVGVTPTTATINVLRYGEGGGRVIYHDGTTRDLGAQAVAGFLGELGETDAAAIRQVEVFAPLEFLRRVEIVDTPGLNSLRAAHEKIARDFLVEADAIVWIFAAGQAAKATEREALTLAHAAGKRVLGVVNKIDRASVEDVAQIVRHVETELRDLVERVVPLSARTALVARVDGDAGALEASGLPALETALESGFFARARELKRSTAIAALRRFVGEARAALAAPPRQPGEPGEPHEPGGLKPTRAAIATSEEQLRSTLASERVALRARLEEGIRAAAIEVREFVRPRAWLFGESSVDPGDEAFLGDLLDDGVLAATAATRAALRAAVPQSPVVPPTYTADLSLAIDDAVERFRAYARGIMEGAAAVFFRVDLPRIRLDLAAIHRALGRWSPDPEEALFRPVERAIGGFVARANADLDDRALKAEIASVIREEHMVFPLDALADAVTALEQTRQGDAPPAQ
jgi:Flp pilus assembly protein TadD/GTP-binding protein EngB required for normal cell division